MNIIFQTTMQGGAIQVGRMIPTFKKTQPEMVFNFNAAKAQCTKKSFVLADFNGF